MVLAAHRAYRTATRFARAARPRDVARGDFARRAFAGSFSAGAAVLAAIAILAPAQFGQPGADTTRMGWPLLALLALLGAAVLLGIARRARIGWMLARIREPFQRPLEEEPHFDDAADALARCPAPLRLRFAVAWVWAPVAWAVLGGTCAFSCAYFLVDAVLARGRVGWQQPLYALVFAVASITVFAAAAGRLASWRFAAGIHKEVSTGYLG